jgi:hypothetical protein
VDRYRYTSTQNESFCIPNFEVVCSTSGYPPYPDGVC